MKRTKRKAKPNGLRVLSIANGGRAEKHPTPEQPEQVAGRGIFEAPVIDESTRSLRVYDSAGEVRLIIEARASDVTLKMLEIFKGLLDDMDPPRRTLALT